MSYGLPSELPKFTPTSTGVKIQFSEDSSRSDRSKIVLNHLLKNRGPIIEKYDSISERKHVENFSQLVKALQNMGPKGQEILKLLDQRQGYTQSRDILRDTVRQTATEQRPQAAERRQPATEQRPAEPQRPTTVERQIVAEEVRPQDAQPRTMEEQRPSAFQEARPQASEGQRQGLLQAAPDQAADGQHLTHQQGNAQGAAKVLPDAGGSSLPSRNTTAQPATAKGGQSPALSPNKSSEEVSGPTSSRTVLLRDTGAETGLTVKGFTKEQQIVILQQVLIASILFKAANGDQAKESSSTLLQAAVLMQKSGAIEQDLSKLLSQMQEAVKDGKEPSAAQKNAMAATLDSLLKQIDTLQKQANALLKQPGAPYDNAFLENDPMNAVLMAKTKCDSLQVKMQMQLEESLGKLGERANSKLPGAQTGASDTADLENAPTSTTVQESQSKSASAILSGAKPDSMNQGGKVADQPSLPLTASDAAKQVGLIKTSLQSPLLVQGSSDLQVLADKLQKKETVAPFNIALTYPLVKKEQSQIIGGAKSDSKDGSGKASVQLGGERVQEMVLVPAGPALVQGKVVDLGDYLISVFPVTNEQYADWLNAAYDDSQITLSENGAVLDQHRNVLCKTHAAASTSQIQVAVVKERVTFAPLKGTQRHPVVQVSWEGAEAYCSANQFRLPTEAEWEKAAGMQLQQADQSLTSFSYGFGKDEIDLTWANFRDELKEYSDNRTTPVGFYNGETVFTKKGKSFQSKNACSPYGCYDMSGNVRQWVSGKGEAVAKGGSYNSPPEELQVSARTLRDPKSCYPDTGFRVVFDLS